MPWKKIPVLPAIGVLALIYFFAGKIGLHLATVHRSASPVWPPTGIALAALLLCGYRVWPGIFIGAFFVNATTAGNVATSLGIAGANTIEALAGAWLTIRFARGVNAFERSQYVFRFALAVTLASTITPTIGASVLAFTGFEHWPQFGDVWTTWWLGDITGALVFTPLLLLWGSPPRWRFDRQRDREVGVLLALLVVLAEIVFGGWLPISAKNYPIVFLCGPVVIWTAFRLSPREAASAVFVLAAISIWGTVHGYGPFVMQDRHHSLLILQSWTAVLSVTAMALAAAMAQRRKAEAAIEQQRATVEAANRTNNNFLAMLSHELRTPLTPVLAALETLDSSAQTPDAKAALAMIRRNVELERQLIDDLLDLTRIASDKILLQRDTLDLHQVIANVVEICRIEAAERKLRLHTNLRAGAHFVSADAAKMQQVIWNVAKNAIKFTPEGGEVAIATGNPAPQVFELKITDNGIGIDPEVMKRMFDPFEQGDLSFQHRYGGLGLGLAISKSLAQAHGGSLGATSDGPNRGATFTLTLPTVSPKDRQSPGSTSDTAEKAAAGLRILLVDDHADTCTALERILVRRGYLVATAHDMRSAMAAAGRGEFDLLISDIALPDGSGIELMTYLRAMKDIRGIAISGFGMNGDIEKSLGAGFAEHLVKPIKIDKLAAAIERVTAVASAAEV